MGMDDYLLVQVINKGAFAPFFVYYANIEAVHKYLTELHGIAGIQILLALRAEI